MLTGQLTSSLHCLASPSGLSRRDERLELQPTVSRANHRLPQSWPRRDKPDGGRKDVSSFLAEQSVFRRDKPDGENVGNDEIGNPSYFFAFQRQPSELSGIRVRSRLIARTCRCANVFALISITAAASLADRCST